MKIVKKIKSLYRHLIQSLFKKEEPPKPKPKRRGGKAVIFCRKCKSGVWTTNFDMKLCSDCTKRQSRKERKRRGRKNENRNLRRAFVSGVKHRDRYQCKDCGKTHELTVHHILHQSTHPHLKYQISNGITLCIECHKTRHVQEASG